MAQVKDIFGTSISGKLNQVVFYQRYGKTFVRSLPIRKNKNATLGQIQNRLRFGAMQNFSKLFKYVVIPQIWSQASKAMAGRQLFIKTNKAAFDANGIISDPKLVQLSIGDLHLPEGIKVSRKEEGSPLMKVSWYPDSGGGDLAYWDELLVISLGEGQYSEMKATNIQRGKNGGVFEMPELNAVISHIYLFFSSLDKRHYSESVCFQVDPIHLLP